MKKTKDNNQIQDLEGRLLRALADYQNLEKRQTSDRLSLLKYANQKLLSDLLPLLDDLYRAQEHLQDAGLQIVLDHFNRLLKDNEVSEINALEKAFDPQTMDCAEVVTGDKDKVVNVISRGYLHADRVLRPARVSVGSGDRSPTPGVAGRIPRG